MNRHVAYGVAVAAVGASLCGLSQPVAAQGAAARGAADKAVATPRTADGHPDLSGVWGGGLNEFVGVTDTGDVTVLLGANGKGSVSPDDLQPVHNERSAHLTRRSDPNKPLYKPQFWEKVRALNDDGSNVDPSYGCNPSGVPRMGAPNRIVQLPNEILFLYSTPYTSQYFREIPTNGRPHSPAKELEGTWMGEARGQWDGDTLVVDSIGFIDESWLDIAGYFHSEHMRVTERLRREGNTIVYQATVEDPDVLLKPWVMNARTLRLDPNPQAGLGESLPCNEKDAEHLVSKENH